ncbi:unnamed protein product [Onchocerca ochengi]|uniref:Uncharacterized protein n=1 Tax=Onchocerca ochengi TaxID=42157 RepID=A0A182E385_ONCOC|nr:unnamed protein product [Onchocerca ochengi]
MAFYFALMNISKTTFDNSTKRRSLSLSHNHDHLQRSNRRRCTIISYGANGLQKQGELSSQTCQGRREFYKVEKNSKPIRNDIQEKKVMFEKREFGKKAIQVDNFLKSHAFLDAWLLNKKRSNSGHEAKVEKYPLGLSACSDHVKRVNDQIITLSTVQNNELIENKLFLSAPIRKRNFWKPANLLRRRSASDIPLKYTWSYFNPGFHFVEDEFKAQDSDCNTAIPADNNYIFSSYIYSERLSPLDDF